MRRRGEGPQERSCRENGKVPKHGADDAAHSRNQPEYWPVLETGRHSAPGGTGQYACRCREMVSFTDWA